MKTKKQILLSALGVVFSISTTMAQTGAIKGQIKKTELEPLYGVAVKITQAGVLVGGATTDFDGYYSYKPLNPGSYEAIIQSPEIQTQTLKGIKVNADRTTYVDFKASPYTLGGVTVTATFTESIIDQNMTTMKSMDADAFLKSSAGDRGDIKAAIVSIASDVSMDDNGDLHVRGSRGDATDFIIDGVRTPYLSGVSALSVENLSVITGGIPAQYGDCLGGVIVVTTKDYFSGIRRKHMHETDVNERLTEKCREKQAKADEEKRKLEIEKELELEKAKM